MVQLKVLSPSKSVIIEAICTPFICSDILSQNVHSVDSQYEHLQNLTLADSSPDGIKRIDILVLFLVGFSAAVMKLKEMFTLI